MGDDLNKIDYPGFKKINGTTEELAEALEGRSVGAVYPHKNESRVQVIMEDGSTINIFAEGNVLRVYGEILVDSDEAERGFGNNLPLCESLVN